MNIEFEEDETRVCVGADYRGYAFTATRYIEDRMIRIYAGCRCWKTFEEARNHYGVGYTSSGNREECLALINALEQKARARGWLQNNQEEKRKYLVEYEALVIARSSEEIEATNRDEALALARQKVHDHDSGGQNILEILDFEPAWITLHNISVLDED